MRSISLTNNYMAELRKELEDRVEFYDRMIKYAMKEHNKKKYRFITAEAFHISELCQRRKVLLKALEEIIRNQP